MKYLNAPALLAVLAAGFLSTALAPSAEARIGESRDTIERRLLPAGAIMYRNDAIEEARQRGMPYRQYTDYFPEFVELRIYFKTDTGRKPKSSDMEDKRMHDGWDMHVLYLRGKSVLEVYKRSKSITEPEMNQLLMLQSNGSYWKKVKANQPPAEGEDPVISAFSVDMMREDGLIRAKKVGGDSILFVDSEIDTKLANLKQAGLLESAPTSIRGF